MKEGKNKYKSNPTKKNSKKLLIDSKCDSEKALKKKTCLIKKSILRKKKKKIKKNN